MRVTLRDLPLPAKLVVSVFLLAVGLGYFSAMVQLHLRHSSRNGKVLPTPDDVVAVFAGKMKYDANAPKPTTKLEALVMGPIENVSFDGKGSMAAAFFHKDDGTFKRATNPRRGEAGDVAKITAEREGERQAVKAWINLPATDREKAYEANKIDKPKDMSITEDFVENNQIKIKSILDERCARCHCKGGDQQNYPLECYKDFEKYLILPPVEEPDANGMVSSGVRYMDVDKLTQSTHAHLLSFAMLFTLTGFVFAFTSYPKIVRLVIAPIVLIAQVSDVSCWWLARIPDVGIYFAYAIIGTGTVVGLGLSVQIVGSLFDMYGRRGKMVLVLLFAVAAGGFGVLYTKAIEPALQAETKK